MLRFRNILLAMSTMAIAQAHMSQQQASCNGTRCHQDRRRPCSRGDNMNFNENLMNLFRAEYGKELSSEADTRKILYWKFESLDRNDDDFLQRSEYKPLRRLKKLVKPKKCAKTFARSCDRNKDTKISKEEWALCLGFDIVSLRSTIIVSLSEHKRKDEPEANDCLSDRETVLAEQRSEEFYVPECASDGRYRRIQCYKSTGYCWCVHEDDGKPIPGTSVKDRQPDCDSYPIPKRMMKGCPADKKESFLDDFSRAVNKNSSHLSLAVISFSKFDSNGNKFLDRKEWKNFRTYVAGIKSLRRCGKRLPRFCDVNNDKRISMTEWSNCLQEFSKQHVVTPSPAPLLARSAGTGKRRGPNPLEKILKDD